MNLADLTALLNAVHPNIAGLAALVTAAGAAAAVWRQQGAVQAAGAAAATATAKVEGAERAADTALDTVHGVARVAAGAEVSEALAARAATAVLVVSRDPANAVAQLLRAKGWPVVSAISPDDAGVAAALVAADLAVFDSLTEAEGLRLLAYTESCVALTPPRTLYTDSAWGAKATLANMISTVAGHVLARALEGEAAKRIMRLYRPPVAVEGTNTAAAGLTPATPAAVAEAKAAAQATLSADVEARIGEIIAAAKATRGRRGGADLLPGDHPAPSAPTKALMLDV